MKTKWVPVTNEFEASYYYRNFGSLPLKLGVDDTRERHLVESDRMMAVDDGGGSSLDSFYDQPDSLPHVLVDLDKMREVKIEEAADEITNVRNQLWALTDYMPMTRGDMRNIDTIKDRLWKVQENLRALLLT